MVTERKPTFWQWISGMPDYPEWEDYKSAGGHLRYDVWKEQGKPQPLGALTPRAKWLTTQPEYAEQEALMQRGEVTGLERARARPTQEELDKIAADKLWQQMEATRVGREEAAWAMPFPGGEEEGKIVTQPDGSTGYWTRDERGYPIFNPLTRATEKAPTGYTTTGGEFQTDNYGRKAYYNERTDSYDYPPDWNVDPKTQKAGYLTPQQEWEQEESSRRAAAEKGWQQQQMGWYREQAQMQQQEQERQFRSQLAANPMSWLQYASYTGEQPVIQPWMLPLMPQQYAGTTAGEQIPGWQGRGGSMTALPGMTTPSAQYWARMGPTGQQQYMGYQQGQGGINPMETQFRLQSQAPPGGRNYGLTWGR